jgi:hypothetical protein
MDPTRGVVRRADDRREWPPSRGGLDDLLKPSDYSRMLMGAPSSVQHGESRDRPGPVAPGLGSRIGA